MDDVRSLNAMQDHVHDRDDVGERLLFFAIERLGLQRVELTGAEVAFAQVVIALTEKSR